MHERTFLLLLEQISAVRVRAGRWDHYALPNGTLARYLPNYDTGHVYQLQYHDGTVREGFWLHRKGPRSPALWLQYLAARLFPVASWGGGGQLVVYPTVGKFPGYVAAWRGRQCEYVRDDEARRMAALCYANPTEFPPGELADWLEETGRLG